MNTPRTLLRIAAAAMLASAALGCATAEEAARWNHDEAVGEAAFEASADGEEAAAAGAWWDEYQGWTYGATRADGAEAAAAGAWWDEYQGWTYAPEGDGQTSDGEAR